MPQEELSESDVGKIFGSVADEVDKDVKGLRRPRRRPDNVGKEDFPVVVVDTIAPRIPLIRCLRNRTAQGFDANVRKRDAGADFRNSLHGDMTANICDYVSGEVVRAGERPADVPLKEHRFE